ncbi:MAG: CYTH and CHAD domain-containing protein [Mycobacteriaceae bacterium]|nr:CYTH and CHAD domain-containing protein [Mycobacteriaceae bacterium]
MYGILERETKWDVDEEFVLPKLDDIVAGGSVERDSVDLTSTYYDTPDRDLLAHGIVLRRRDGDDDTGWQIKIPTKDGRLELHWILTDDPPAELSGLLTGISLGKDLVDVARIHTIRHRYRITGPDKHALCAELADDYVRASVGERLLAWREVEVELGPQARTVPRQLTKRLRQAGAQPARYSSKLAHVSPAAPSRESLTPAARALVNYLNAQIDRIVAGDIGLRRGQDPIHDTRVATRRLRSTLRVFGKLLDPSAAREMDDELKWFAGLLGEVRDCQVQRRRFTGALDDIPDELVLGPVKSRVRADLQAVELPARNRVTEAMDSPRYLAIMATLRRWRTDPPIDSDLRAGALAKRARRARRKADKRLDAAISSGEDAMLHRARKAAKRARYAGELLEPLDKSKRANRTIKHYKRIQTVLGDHQDTVVATATLRRMAIGAGTTPGENGFTYGLLYAREQDIARRSRQHADTLI